MTDPFRALNSTVKHSVSKGQLSSVPRVVLETNKRDAGPEGQTIIVLARMRLVQHDGDGFKMRENNILNSAGEREILEINMPVYSILQYV